MILKVNNNGYGNSFCINIEQIVGLKKSYSIVDNDYYIEILVNGNSFVIGNETENQNNINYNKLLSLIEDDLGVINFD